MNPTAEFLLSPILSLFSLSFYRRLLKRTLGTGLAYLAYLSAAGALVVTFVFQSRFLPLAQDFVDWFSKEMPEMTVDQGVVSSPVTQPYRMKHPTFGTVMILDTAKETLTPDEIKESMLYVVKSMVYTRNPVNGEIRVFDLQAMEKKSGKKETPQTLRGEMIRTIFLQARKYMALFLFFLAWIFLFMWKISAALVYSITGLILNTFREEQLPYSILLNLSSFALTAVSVLQGVSLVTANPLFVVHFWMAFVITTLYLGLALFVASSPDKVSQS